MRDLAIYKIGRLHKQFVLGYKDQKLSKSSMPVTPAMLYDNKTIWYKNKQYPLQAIPELGGHYTRWI